LELHLTRSEILRQARAMLGLQTDNSLSTQIEEQHVVAVRAAAVTVARECSWVNAQARVTVDLGIEQDTLNYPAGCGPGSIRDAAVYDADMYVRLIPRIIPVNADRDQEQAEGGATFDGVLGRPKYIEQRDQIKLHPPSDKAYKIRLDFLRAIDLPTADSVSIVDGMLVVYATASMLARQMGDTDSAAYYGGLYTDQRNKLMAWQSQGSTFAMSTEADLSEGETFPLDDAPNWDRAPTIREV